MSQSVREVVLFAVHDVLRDAPFSRLDLVSCRNLMIYLNREAQRRLFDVFHFSLRPEGELFLGIAETTDEVPSLFVPIDKKYRIYRRLSTHRSAPPLLTGPVSLSLAFADRHGSAERIVLPGKAAAAAPAAGATEGAVEGISVSEFHLKLSEQFAPPSLIVDPNGHIVHLSPKAGRFLHFGGGELSKNLLQVVHPMLRIEVRAALFRAAETSAPVEVRSVPVEFDPAARERWIFRSARRPNSPRVTCSSSCRNRLPARRRRRRRTRRHRTT